MNEFSDFLDKLNKLTKETGIIIDTFGDQFYDPSLATDETHGGYNAEDRIYFSYDDILETYVGRIGDPYDGEIVFPVNYVES